MTNYSSVAVFRRAFLSSRFPVSFFYPSVSGNEARIRVRIQALWQSSACCAWSRAGLCHSPWARLMIADGQGINWSSEGVGRSSKAGRRGSPGTLFVGPLHLLAAAGFSPALTESTGLCLDSQDSLIYGPSSLLLSERCWPKFCYWQKDEVLFVFLWPLCTTHLLTTDKRSGSLLYIFSSSPSPISF